MLFYVSEKHLIRVIQLCTPLTPLAHFTYIRPNLPNLPILGLTCLFRLNDVLPFAYAAFLQVHILIYTNRYDETKRSYYKHNIN